MMVIDADMFCPWCKLWRLGYLDVAMFILEHLAFDFRKGEVKVENDTKFPK